MDPNTESIDGGHSLPPTNCLGTPGAVVVGVTPVAADSPVSVWGGGPDADPADVHGRPANGTPQRMAQNPDPARTELARAARRWLQAQGRIAAASLQAGEEAAKILRLIDTEEGGLDVSWPLIVDGTVIDYDNGRLTLRQGTEL